MFKSELCYQHAYNLIVVPDRGGKHVPLAQVGCHGVWIYESDYKEVTCQMALKTGWHFIFQEETCYITKDRKTMEERRNCITC